MRIWTSRGAVIPPTTTPANLVFLIWVHWGRIYVIQESVNADVLTGAREFTCVLRSSRVRFPLSLLSLNWVSSLKLTL